MGRRKDERVTTLSQLPDGGRFRLDSNGATGVVVRQTMSGTLVRMDRAKRQVEVRSREGGEVLASFVAPGKPVILAGGSEVEALP